MNKKKLGIIGGMGSLAGADFLRKVLLYSPALKDQDFPEIILHNNSAVPDRTRAILFDEPSPTAEIIRSIELFNQQKIDYIALACITSYFFYSDIQTHTKAKIINPLAIVKDHFAKHHSQVKRIGLLATTGTLRCGLFSQAFRELNVELITLNEWEQEAYFMKSLYMEGGLKSSATTDNSKELFFKAMDTLTEKGIEVLIGGCSEVSIVLNKESIAIPFVDPMDLMAREAVHLCYN